MEKKYTILIFLLIICSIASAQQKVNISGEITDKDNNPLIGANVYFSGTTCGTTTNAKGEYLLKNIKPGTYELCVSYSGYKKSRQQIEVGSEISGLVISMEESNGNLGEIVVTGTGTPHHLKSAPVPTELLTRKMIENVSATDFSTLMTTVSPSFDFSPNTMGSFMQLNGLGNDFIVVMIDGKRVSGDMGGNNDLGRINPNNIERVEVVKGASSSLYGSDAIAGVINIITKKSKQALVVSNSSQYSNYNTLQQTTNIDFNTRRISGHTSFSLKSSDGWQNSPYEIEEGAEGQDSLVETYGMTQNAYLNRSIKQDLIFNVTKKLSVNGYVSHYYNNNLNPVEVKDYGFFFEDLSAGAGAKYLISKKSRLVFDFNNDRYTYYYKYNKDVSSKSSEYKKDELAFQSEQIRSDYNLKYINKIGKSQTITVGSELVNEVYIAPERVINGEADVNTLSLYGQDEITLFEDLMITAGVRFVNHEEFGNVITPKISLLYRFAGFNFRGTYSQGFKAPTLKELYYEYEKRGTVYMGNTDLDPQTSNYYSLGVDYHNAWLSTSVSTYRNDVDGLIIYKTVDTLPGDGDNGIKKRSQHYNVENAQTKGIDFMLDVQLPYGFTLGGGYSYVDAKNLADSTWLPYVAHHYGNVRVGYSHRWDDYNLSVQLLGRIQDGKYNERGYAKGFELWKLTTNHKFADIGGSELSLVLGVDNIFDYVDDTPFGEYRGTLNPGRTFLAGVNIKFTK